jgi:hypothetical protein
MKLIRKSKFTRRFYDENQALIKSVWLLSTEFMTDVRYRQEMLSAVELVKKYPCKYFLADTTWFKYVISPDLQDWTATHIAEAIANLGVMRFAYIIPEEYISSLSVEQTVEEADQLKVNKPYHLAYFYTEEEAREWLFHSQPES